MRRFTLQRMGDATGRVAQRFPLPLLAALTAAVAGIALVKHEDSTTLLHVLITGQLSISFLLAASLLGERLHSWIPVAAGTLLAVTYGVSLPGHLHDADWLRFVHLDVGAHLLVCVAPFLQPGRAQGQWAFSLILLLRFITAAFFSLVLFAGLSVALLALDQLLGMNVDDDLYFQLFIIIGFVFNTGYLLAGVPGDLDAAGVDADQPRVIRVFARYILAPLVAVYLVILLIYLGKVITTTVWPSGWIGYLVSSVAVAGLLSLLLLAPAFEREDQRWVRRYARVFHVLMIPAVIMLAMAVQKRIGQYGVTEPRYVLLVLTAWLAVMVALGAWRPQPRVWAIPATLCALAFLTALGPWSSFAVSRRAQLGRLDALLVANERLVDGVLVPSGAVVPREDVATISRQLDYLFGHFGTGVLGRRTPAELKEKLDRRDDDSWNPVASSSAATTMEFVGLTYRSRWLADPSLRQRFRRKAVTATVDAAGCRQVLPAFDATEDTLRYRADEEELRLYLDPAVAHLDVTLGNRRLRVPLDDLKARLQQYRKDHGDTDVPDSLLTVDASGLDLRARLLVDLLQWSEGDSLLTPRLSGALLLDW